MDTFVMPVSDNLDTTLQSDNTKKSRKKMLITITGAVIVLLIALVTTLVLINSKPSVNENTNNNSDIVSEPVASSPQIAVGETTPPENIPVPVPNTLTKFTFAKAYGFNFMYDSSLWTITTEPTSIREVDGSNAAGAYLDMELKSDSSTQFQIAFKKTDGVMQEGNTSLYCRENYKIIKEQGPLGSDGPIAQDKQGLIRLFVDGNGYVYSDFYIDSTTNPNAKCINLARSFYEEDDNRIDWVAAITANPSGQLELIDEIMKTARFN